MCVRACVVCALKVIVVAGISVEIISFGVACEPEAIPTISNVIPYVFRVAIILFLLHVERGRVAYMNYEQWCKFGEKIPNSA